MTNSLEFPLSLGLQKAGLPLIISENNNLCFLLDTGATNNVIFNYVYEHFKEEFKRLDKNQSIMGIEGSYQEAPIVEATFNVEGVDYTSSFSVLEASDAMQQVQKETGIQIHGILGVQFLLENKWILDFKKLTITVK